MNNGSDQQREKQGVEVTGRRARYRIHALLLDVATVVLLYSLAVVAHRNPLPTQLGVWAFVTVALLIHIATNHMTGVYTIVTDYMSLGQCLRVVLSSGFAIAALALIAVYWRAPAALPLTYPLLGGLGTMVAMVAVRFRTRIYAEINNARAEHLQRLLVVGAGQAADMLIREIKRTPAMMAKVIGLVDDNSDMVGMTLQGCKVLGTPEDVPQLVQEHKVSQVVIGIPSASPNQLAHLYRKCKPSGVPVRMMPSLSDLLSGVSPLETRDLNPLHLLGRRKVETDLTAIAEYLGGKCVAVTGAGGSIGSELCAQIASFHPAKLVLIDHDESSLYDLHEKLQMKGFGQYALCPVSILQQQKLEQIFRRHRPEVVFHAAAYKHVPLMELHPDQAVINNVLGTLTVGRVAAAADVKTFTNISTDKAVEPNNIMGATKAVTEIIMSLFASEYSHVRFASVRFGNVLGSQGSVIPIFRRQIETGGPVTITHPGMTRYFMLIEEAVQLVLQTAVLIDSCSLSCSGDIFILDMGQPIDIVELAHQMITLYNGDHTNGNGRNIGVEFTGLRPGERVSEKLTSDDEEVFETSHPLIYRVRSPSRVQGEGALELQEKIDDLILRAKGCVGRDAIIEALLACLPAASIPQSHAASLIGAKDPRI